MQELDEIQLRSNTKDARAGRNTNTSILVATDMHATEALNQQWETTSNGNRFQIRSNCRYSSRAYRVSSSGTSWRFHLAVYHKTTRLCIALSAHGSTRAKCIRSNGTIQIRSNTKGARTGRNTNTSILVATDMHATETLNQQWAQKKQDPVWSRHRLVHKECPPQGHSLCTRRCS